MKFLNIDEIISVSNSSGYVRSRHTKYQKYLLINNNGNDFPLEPIFVPYNSYSYESANYWNTLYYFVFKKSDIIEEILNCFFHESKANSFTLKFNNVTKRCRICSVSFNIDEQIEICFIGDKL